MLREMCWLSPLGRDGTKILHLRTHAQQTWQPYTAFPEYRVPDYQVPKGSRGWATYQTLLSQGWVLVPSSIARPTYAEKSAS